MKNLIVLLAASSILSSSHALASYNTSPVLNPVEEFVYNSAEVSEKSYVQIRVTDLLNVLESSTSEDVIFDLENIPAYTVERKTDGSLDLINNMGIAVVESKAGGVFAALEFHSGIAGDKWTKFSELSDSASKLLNPKCLIRFDVRKVPQAVSGISLGFKLWDMSNESVVDVTIPQDTNDNSNDSPFSKDTQVVYVKIPWASVSL